MAGGTVAEGSARWRLSPPAARLRTHPLVLASLVVLVLNDHVLKARWPGPVTGIASDVAGLILLPAAIVLLADAVRRTPLSDRAVAGIGAAVALGFASVELVPFADAAYEVGLGIAGWPVRARFGGSGLRVVATPDRWDLLALPFAATAGWLWTRPLVAPVAVPVGSVEPNARRPSARLGPLVVVLLLPALMATSPEPEDIEAETTMASPVVLDAAHPSQALIVTVESDLEPGDERQADIQVSVPHDPGEPAVLVTVTSEAEPVPLVAHLASGASGIDAGSGPHVELGPCAGRCRLEARIVVELLHPEAGTWSHPLSVVGRLRGPTSGEVEVAIAPDAEPPPPSRRLASATLGASEADRALVVRTRPAVGDPAIDDPDTVSGQEPTILLLADVAAEEAVRLAVQDQGRSWIAYEGFPENGWPLRPATCGQAVAACEQQAVLFSDDEDGAGAGPPLVVDVVDARGGGAPGLSVELLPARWEQHRSEPGDELARTGLDVAVPPGQTLVAMVRQPKGAPTSVSADRLTLEAARSDGSTTGTIRQPAPTTIETCPADAPSPCTVHLTWTIGRPVTVQIDTLLVVT